MKRKFLALGCALYLVWGCASVQEHDLLGTWKPFELVDNDSLAVDLSKSELRFKNGTQYVYQKTALEIVSGQYKVDYPILYLYPNTAADTARLQILKLEEEVLTLRMNNRGKEQILKLKRQ